MRKINQWLLQRVGREKRKRFLAIDIRENKGDFKRLPA